jgi:nucleoside-diphosphate-sugar epimerase
MKKTIFIIGANSAVAKETIKVLSKDNKIITGGRHGCDVYCDISKEVNIPEGVDTVINFAAAFGGDSDRNILNTISTNIVGTLKICMAAKEAGIKHLVLISSIFALLEDGSPFYNYYSITKKQADELAAFYCANNKIALAVLQPSQIYGDGEEFSKHQPFFYTIIDKAERGEDISIYGRNDARRNYMHVADLVEIINRVVINNVKGIYTCAYPSDISYSQIAKKAQNIFNKGGKVNFLNDKPDIPDNVFKEDPSIDEAINFSPGISIEEGITSIKKTRESGKK